MLEERGCHDVSGLISARQTPRGAISEQRPRLYGHDMQMKVSLEGLFFFFFFLQEPEVLQDRPLKRG